MLKQLRALVPYLTKYKSTYAIGMVCVVVSNALITLGPKILEHGINLIDGGASPAAVGRAALLLARRPNRDLAVRLLFAPVP